MIEVRRVSKRYGRRTAVDDVSFTAPPGCVTGLLGPNGAGKSTVMRVVLGLDRPSRGSATIDGRRYASLRRPLCQVGAVLDANAVHPARSGWHHVWAIAQSNRLSRDRARSVLEEVGLGEAAARRAGGYSLGMRQRLGMAVALLGDPSVLLLDEPANGLDPEGMVWIRALLRSLAAEGRTVLVSSHLLGEVAQTADRLVVLGQGRLLAETTVAALTTGGRSLEDAYLELCRPAGLHREMTS